MLCLHGVCILVGRRQAISKINYEKDNWIGFQFKIGGHQGRLTGKLTFEQRLVGEGPSHVESWRRELQTEGKQCS